jgi:UDP-N-acetylmuramate: L-alanyl-gamma-D-glutamyl-meso-diaminopimelate ligase
MLAHDLKTIYMMGIGGIAMGTLATMLKARGYRVVGSDQNLYPPMSTHLEQAHIPVCTGYDPDHLKQHQPDVVIIGNVIRRENPEAQFVLNHHLPYLSMPEALEHFFLPSHQSIVVTGTHGKSTTSALLAWVLEYAGLDPSAFVGGLLRNWQQSYRLGRGPYMVLEGDEYDTAFFDKKPKFLHYRPHIGIITSIEFDHADIFADFAAVFQAFREFQAIVPETGWLVVNADDPNCRALLGNFTGKLLTYGEADNADWRLVDVRYLAGRVEFTCQTPQGTRLTMLSTLPGRHNLMNTLAVIAVASLVGIAFATIQEALLAFQGVKRRQEILGEAGGVLVIDDFAHHPTAVQETIQAMRFYYPNRRIIALFEPRTNSSRRNIFQANYEAAFDGADVICIKEPDGLDSIPIAERLDIPGLVAGIRKRNRSAHFFQHGEDLLAFCMDQCRPGDVALAMSNGSFDGLPQRLLEALKVREKRL